VLAERLGEQQEAPRSVLSLATREKAREQEQSLER
jgi:hypothetical protein